MIRTNLLVERLIFERKSGGATINYQRDNEVVYGSCKDESHPIMSIHNCVRFCLDECEQACSSPLPVRDLLSGMKLSNVPTAHSDMGGMATLSGVRSVDTAVSPCDPLFEYVLQCLVRSCMDHRAESHRVCSGASVVSIYGRQSRLHARAKLALQSHSTL